MSRKRKHRKGPKVERAAKDAPVVDAAGDDVSGDDATGEIDAGELGLADAVDVAGTHGDVVATTGAEDDVAVTGAGDEDIVAASHAGAEDDVAATGAEDDVAATGAHTDVVDAVPGDVVARGDVVGADGALAGDGFVGGADGVVAGADDDSAEVGAGIAAELPTSASAMDALQLKYLIEALVFASDKPVTLARLRQLTRVSEMRRIEQALEALADDYRDRGLVLQQVSGGYQFRTRTQWALWVQQLIAGRPVRLSRAQLETLAIIAYRQPITRPEIDDIRGVDSSQTLKLLLDRALIRMLGKKEEVGRPILYGTTKEFLDFFSLGDLRELPTLREYSELTDESRRRMGELGVEPPTPDGAEREVDDVSNAADDAADFADEPASAADDTAYAVDDGGHGAHDAADAADDTAYAADDETRGAHGSASGRDDTPVAVDDGSHAAHDAPTGGDDAAIGVDAVEAAANGKSSDDGVAVDREELVGHHDAAPGPSHVVEDEDAVAADTDSANAMAAGEGVAPGTVDYSGGEGFAVASMNAEEGFTAGSVDLDAIAEASAELDDVAPIETGAAPHPTTDDDSPHDPSSEA